MNNTFKTIITVLFLLSCILTCNSVFAVDVTTSDVINASDNVVSSVEKTHQLPSTVNVGSKSLTMPQYLYASSKTLLKINNTNTEDTSEDNDVLKEVISVHNVNGPLNKLNPTAAGGVLNKTEYMDVYNRVSGFSEREGRLPTLLSTSLGDVHCNSFLYLSGQLLNSYKVDGVLPDFIHMETWNTLSERAHTFYTHEQVESAAQWTENYIETHHLLPDKVEIAGKKIDTYIT